MQSPVPQPKATTRDEVFEIFSKQLRSHRGIFVGEWHVDGMAPAFLSSYMRQLKAQGVTTLYLEYDPYDTQARNGGTKCAINRAKSHRESPVITNFDMTIFVANQIGLRVIGYDDATLAARNHYMRTGDGSKITSNEAIDRRNRFGAEMIERTWDGKKFVILGGAAHSGTHDYPGPGLDQLLGIPSFDLMMARHDLTTTEQLQQIMDALSHKPIATTMQRGGDNATYIVTTENSLAMLRPPHRTKEEIAHSKQLAQAAARSGICNMEPRLAHRDILSPDDIDVMAQRLSPPPIRLPGIRP